MIFGLFGSRREDPLVDMLHEATVAQSRQPSFYLDYGVADSVDGRYDLLILHTFLMFRWLKTDEGRGARLAQALCDRVFFDLDRSLREMGVGDLSVPKRMKKMAQMFYGRVAAYEEALASAEEDDLARALDRNVYRGDGVAGEPSRRLARYVRAATGMLTTQTVRDAAPDLPDPASVG
jgi:cytochrome b pre-mRNA-processing protein 3